MEPVSLHSPVGEEDGSELGDLIEDSESVPPAELVSAGLLASHVEAVLTHLGEREREVVRMRYGLGDGEPRTLEEVGRAFGVTRERVRQIEAKSLAKLRHPHLSAAAARLPRHLTRLAAVRSLVGREAPSHVRCCPTTRAPRCRWTAGSGCIAAAQLADGGWLVATEHAPSWVLAGARRGPTSRTPSGTTRSSCSSSTRCPAPVRRCGSGWPSPAGCPRPFTSG